MRRIPLGDDEIAELKGALQEWKSKASGYYSLRGRIEDELNCVWARQSLSGLVEDRADSLADPFDGASDQRIRWGDKIIQRTVSLLILSLRRAEVKFRASGADGQKTARNLSLLLESMIADMGSEWLRQWLLLGFWYCSDSPSVAMMGVEWRSEPVQEVAWLDVNEAAALASDGTAMGIEGVVDEIEGDGETPVLAGFLEHAYGVTDSADVKRIVGDLREKGEAEFVYVERVKEGPVLQALRFGDDFVIPDTCTDFTQASPWFRVEWVTREALESRIESDGWDSDFVESALGYESQALLADNSRSEERKGLYQLVWVYARRADADGVWGRYVGVFSLGEGSAFGWRLLSGRGGAWPGVFFGREVRSAKLIESRGIAELAAPTQGVAKQLRDTAADNGIVGGLPPIKAKGNNARNMKYAPLEIIGMNVNEDAQFLQPPAYPATAMAEADRLRDELMDYFGLRTKDGDEEDNLQHRQCGVQWWLDQAADVMVMMVNLAKRYASDGYLQQVTNERDVFGLRRSDISGPFRLSLRLSVEDLNSEKMVAKMNSVGQTLLAMDRNRVVDTTPIVTLGLRSLFPDVSEDALRTQEAGMQEEMDAEAQNLVKIRAGVMPAMDTEGRWNYDARLAFYRGIQERNPAAFDDMSEDKRLMLAQWIEALGQQAQQFGANAELGRTGVEGVPAG